MRLDTTPYSIVDLFDVSLRREADGWRIDTIYEGQSIHRSVVTTKHRVSYSHTYEIKSELRLFAKLGIAKGDAYCPYNSYGKIKLRHFLNAQVDTLSKLNPKFYVLEVQKFISQNFDANFELFYYSLPSPKQVVVKTDSGACGNGNAFTLLPDTILEAVNTLLVILNETRFRNRKKLLLEECRNASYVQDGPLSSTYRLAIAAHVNEEKKLVDLKFAVIFEDEHPGFNSHEGRVEHTLLDNRTFLYSVEKKIKKVVHFTPDFLIKIHEIETSAILYRQLTLFYHAFLLTDDVQYLEKIPMMCYQKIHNPGKTPKAVHLFFVHFFDAEERTNVIADIDDEIAFFLSSLESSGDDIAIRSKKIKLYCVFILQIFFQTLVKAGLMHQEKISILLAQFNFLKLLKLIYRTLYSTDSSDRISDRLFFPITHSEIDSFVTCTLQSPTDLCERYQSKRNMMLFFSEIFKSSEVGLDSAKQFVH